jgi:hypothetical protein
MEKRDSHLNQIIADHSEIAMIEWYIGELDYKVSKICPDNKFDEKKIRKFLRGHTKTTYIIMLLKGYARKRKIEKKSGWCLPDFIFVDKDNMIGFIEIKKMKKSAKFKFSEVIQKNAIRDLASKGFMNYVTWANLPTREDLTDEEIAFLLKNSNQNNGVLMEYKQHGEKEDNTKWIPHENDDRHRVVDYKTGKEMREKTSLICCQGCDTRVRENPEIIESGGKRKYSLYDFGEDGTRVLTPNNATKETGSRYEHM